MNGSEFIDAINEKPRDLTRKLVYADWLEEIGDPRGAEYLRLECEFARESLLEDRYWDLKIQRDQMRTELDPDWLDELTFGETYWPMFDKLRTQRMERWRQMDRLIDYWHAPLTKASGYSEEEIEDAEQRLKILLPAAMKEFYLIAGKRIELWHHRNRCYSLDGLLKYAHCLEFEVDPYGHDRLGIHMQSLSAEDPSVWNSHPMIAAEEEDGPQIVSPQFSLHILRSLLTATAGRAPVRATGQTQNIDKLTFFAEADLGVAEDISRLQKFESYAAPFWIDERRQRYKSSRYYFEAPDAILATDGVQFEIGFRSQDAYDEIAEYDGAWFS